ncbi:hypothetical protein ACQ5TV_11885 [Acetobacter ghanensis]
MLFLYDHIPRNLAAMSIRTDFTASCLACSSGFTTGQDTDWK